MSKPITGIAASKTPKMSATRSLVRPSTPPVPIPIAAARFDGPTDTATMIGAATMTRRWRTSPAVTVAPLVYR
jgi:hypothetical protein